MTAAAKGRLDPAKDAKVLCVAGARPNVMKIAPILDALRTRSQQITARLVLSDSGLAPKIQNMSGPFRL